MKWLMFIAAIGGAIWFLAPEGGFDKDEIERVKKAIKAEFEKKDGFSVLDVNMLKENNRKLAGYVNLQIKDIPGQVTKACNAMMEESGGKYMWRCE